MGLTAKLMAPLLALATGCNVVFGIPDPSLAETEDGAPIVPPIEVDGSDQLLLPYDLFTRLWNRAHPDRTLVVAPAPAAYALAGGAFAGEVPSESTLAALSGEPFVHFTGESWGRVLIARFSHGLWETPSLAFGCFVADRRRGCHRCRASRPSCHRRAPHRSPSRSTPEGLGGEDVHRW